MSSESDDGGDDDIVTTASVESVTESEAIVTRTAAFAEVVKDQQDVLNEEKHVSDASFHDELLRLDAELAGTVRAQSQAATNFDVVHPVTNNDDEELSEIEETILGECEQLIHDLSVDTNMSSFVATIVTHGDDVSKLVYDEDRGVTDLQSLPLRALTIVDEKIKESGEFGSSIGSSGDLIDGIVTLSEDSSASTDHTITSADFYVLNESDDENRKVIKADDVLHISLDNRANWREDNLGRATYGVWGRQMLEPVKFAVQAKQNTLSNKVAMDDKLLAREIYQIDVETLFGHIQNDKKRTGRAEEYAGELKKMLQDLGPDEKPILPEEVGVEMIGPEGKARDQASFIEMMNNSIMHGLNYHIAGMGRDAGGSEAGNRPSKQVSEDNIRHIQALISNSFRRLFAIHTLLLHEEARETVDDGDDVNTVFRNWKLAEDVTLPEIVFAPLSEESDQQKVETAVKGFESKLMSFNEARERIGLDPLTEDEMEQHLEEFERLTPSPEEEKPGDDGGDGPQGDGGGGGGATPDDNQAPEWTALNDEIPYTAPEMTEALMSQYDSYRDDLEAILQQAEPVEAEGTE